MRHVIRSSGLALAVGAALASVATAESVARESISPGFQTAHSSNVLHARADDLKQVGDARVLEMTRLADLKGASDTTLRVLVRPDWQDVKAGDEFVVFLVALDGEAIGLGSGIYYRPLTNPFFSMVRVTDANRAEWVERVQLEVSGAATEVIHRCVIAAGSPDRRIAGDALVDLWHHRDQDLSAVLSSQEKAAVAEAILGDAGWKRLEAERVHGIVVLGLAQATEGYAQLLAHLSQELTPDLATSVGQALGRIDAARASQDLSALLTGSPQAPTTPETQLRVLAALRGMAAPDTLPAVQALFSAADPAVRRWAMVTAGYVGAEPARAALVTRLQDGTGLDAWCAAFALHRTGGPEGWAEVRRIAQIHGDAGTRAWLLEFVRNPAMRGQDILVKLVRGY